MKGLKTLLLHTCIACIACVLLLFSFVAHAGPNDGLPTTTVAVDGATPRRAFEGFLQAAHAGDYLRAARFLDLRGVPRNSQGREGPTLAQELAYVVEHKLAVDPATLSDNVEGVNGQAAVGTIMLEDEPVPISLTHVKLDDGTDRWVVSRTTMTMVPSLYGAYGPRGWESKLPAVLTRVRLFGVEAWQWLGLLAALLGSWFAGFVVSRVSGSLARRLAGRTKTPWDDRLVTAARGPAVFVATVLVLRFITEPLRLSAGIERVAQRIGFTLLVIGIAWFVIRAVDVFAEWVVARLPDGHDDNHARGVRTQLAVLQRLSSIVTITVGAAVVLIQFEFVRNVGLSLLASAGVLGIVFGVAAQKSLSGVIAGVQLSITQQLRIGDTIVIEGEYGTVEEINLTYVVVKAWDERRIVVPIARFLDTSFQNWTKVNSEIQGVVLLQADYTLPVEKVRAELERVCRASEDWDRRQASLKVVDVTDRCLTLRALVSAANADVLWGLRCEVREKLMKFLVELEGGRYLVRVRSETVSSQPAT